MELDPPTERPQLAIAAVADSQPLSRPRTLLVRYVRLMATVPTNRGARVRAELAWAETGGRLRTMTEPDLSALRERADNGDADAVDELIELAGEQGNLDELRRLADKGNTTAAEQLTEFDG